MRVLLHFDASEALARRLAPLSALRSGRLGGAGLDAFEDEPIGRDNPLLELDSVVLSPHVAWLTAETMERCVELAAANCRRLQAGEELANRVI